jgi:peptide/nickel transport system permease protein
VLAFSLKRLLRAIAVVLFATFLVIAMLSLAPGSVAVTLLGENATPQAVAALEAELGLDRALPVQYFEWLAGLVQGDFGKSALTLQPVLDSILERLPVTLELAVLAQGIALGVAIPLAVVSASRPGGVVDRGATFFSSIFLSLPAFVAGPLMIYVFSVQWGLFPVTGWARIGEDGLLANLQSALLPAIVIALPEIAAFFRLLRTDLASTLTEDFVDAARARGMPRRYVLWRHALRPSSFSLITLAGLAFGRLLGGTVIVETLFQLPGLGQLLAQAITSRDAVVVQGIVAFVVIGYVLLNGLVDIGYTFLDPRVRREASR